MTKMCLPLPHLETNRLAKGEHLGFAWEVVHNHMGFRCGYVRVLPGHPWFGRGFTCAHDYDDYYAHLAICDESLPDDVRVHGGLTFAEQGKPCPEHGAADEWWIGFDCAHGGDAPDPSLIAKLPPEEQALHGRALDVLAGTMSRYGVVRDEAYVEAECRHLCEQAAAAVKRDA